MKLNEKALLGSLVIYHIWGTILIFRESIFSQAMFDATCFGIFSTLGVLAGEKTIRALGELKWGNGTQTASKPSATANVDGWE